MLKRLFLAFLVLTFIFGGGVFVMAAESENLVLNKQYTIKSGVPIEGSYALHASEDTDSGMLTDGKTGSAGDKSSGWMSFLRGKSRIVEFDLGAEKRIDGFSAGFLHDVAAGVYTPRYVRIYLSLDGENYMMYNERNNISPLSSTAVRRYEYKYITSDEHYKARYVRIEFCVDINVYCDELAVFGGELNGEELEPVADEPNPRYDAPSPKNNEKLHGASDIIKIYNGRFELNGTDDVETGNNTEEEFVPYVAYIDRYGNATDKMFDSVAFVPIHSDYPSGGRLVKTSGKDGAIMSDWLMYLDNTFAEGINVDALNKTVGKLYGELDIDEKMPVFFTLPYPTVLMTKMFGDIDGDGVEDGCKTLEERVKILKWFADLTYERFVDGNYGNLEFAGFYWYREEVNYSDSDHEAELIKEISDYLHSKDEAIIFDAFYLSMGFDNWEDLGFDAAVMQPNLVFRTEYFTDKVLEEFGEIAAKYGLGCEIETTETYSMNDKPDIWGKIYYKYLVNAQKYGYMDCLHTYYQGAGPGCYYDMAYSDDKLLRSLYEDTYLFIKGLFVPEPPEVTVWDIKAVEGEEKRASIKSSFKNTDADKAVIEITRQPENGSVRIEISNRNLYYTSNKDYQGEDSFEITVTDEYGLQAKTEIKVTVEKKSEESKNTESSTASIVENISDKPDNTDEEKKHFPLVPVLVGAGLLLAVAVAVIVIKKKK